MNRQHLADNLRLLCNYKKSISEVCRELQINRQQFNKYLSGKTSPSGSNLRRICDYFGVEQHEIYLPPDEFEPLVRNRPVAELIGAAPVRPEYQCLDQLLEQSEDLSRYEGSYHIYYYSTSYPQKILKGYVCIFPENGRHYIKWIERLSLQEEAGQDSFIYKIKGIVTGLGNRIFVTGYEQILRNDMVHLTLFPTFKNKVSMLSGLQLGISGSDTRQPVCQRVVMTYLGRSCNHREALQRCGVFAENSPEIDPEIRKRIQNDVDEDEKVFLARPV